MTKVIAAVDSSAAAKPVVAMACAVAPVLGASVEALHVDDGDDLTARAAADAAAVPYRAVGGDPLSVLTATMQAGDVVAMTIGARSRPIGTRPVGHLAAAVASRVEKPVILVPPGATPPARLHRVLIALEGTPGRVKNLKRAVELVEAIGLEAVAIHVADEDSIPSFDDQVQYETEAYAHEFLARYAPGLPTTRLELRVGVPADEVLAAADALGSELLAIGWPQTDDPARGVVAREILDRSRIPVLLVALA